MLGDQNRLTSLTPLNRSCSFSLFKLFFKLPKISKTELKSPFSKKSFPQRHMTPFRPVQLRKLLCATSLVTHVS